MPTILPSQPAPRKRKKKSAGGFFANVLGDIPDLGRSIFVDLPVAVAQASATPPPPSVKPFPPALIAPGL